MAAKDDYVDGNAWNGVAASNFGKAINGSGWMVPCHVATVGTETFTVSAGSVTQIAGTTLDGVSPSVGARVLIRDAPTSTGVGSAFSLNPGNGIYSVTNATTNLTVSRVAEMAGTYVPAGNMVRVLAGTLHGGAGFMVTTPNTPAAFTYGTGNIQFTKQPTANMVNGSGGMYVGALESTSSTAYANLTTIADTVTVMIGSSGNVLINISAFIQNDTLNGHSFVGFAMTGANTVNALDANSIDFQAYTASASGRYGIPFQFFGLNPGLTTFKMKYRVAQGTGTFGDRRISIMPMD